MNRVVTALRPYLGLIILGVISAAAIGVAFGPIFKKWVYQYTNELGYYSHGPLVPFLTAYMVYMRRDHLKALPVKPARSGLWLLVPGLIAGMLAHLSYSTGWVIPSLFLLIYGAVAFVLGWQWARAIWFPIAFLGFMMPLPAAIIDDVSRPIQAMSANLADQILKVLQYETYRNGVEIHIPGGYDLLVGSACSGFRTIISLGTFSCFFAYYTGIALWAQTLLVVMAVPLGLLVNAIRIAAVGVAGTVWGDAWGERVHDWGGYVVIVLPLLVLFGLASLLGWNRRES